jgi:hypothetical protein
LIVHRSVKLSLLYATAEEQQVLVCTHAQAKLTHSEFLYRYPQVSKYSA